MDKPVEPIKLMSWDELKAKKFAPQREVYATLKRYAATHLDCEPTYCGGEEVQCRGEKLDKIFWKGRQWAVTSYGVECRDGSYAIAKDRLWEFEEKWGWVRQMAPKAWVDLTDFAEALRIARGHHGK